MIKKIHTLSGCAVLRRLSMLLMVVACVASMQAQNTSVTSLTPNDGFKGREDNTIGGYEQQKVHEDWDTIYSTATNALKLTRKTSAYKRYARWYDYTTGKKMANLTNTDWDRASGRYEHNNYGRVKVWGDGISNFTATYNYDGTSEIYIACEQSAYLDWEATDATLKEPTLSQRIVYYIRPASEMAKRVDNFKSTGTTEFMENYEMVAPLNKNVFIGPKHAYKDATNSMDWHANYFCNKNNPQSMADGTWTWTKVSGSGNDATSTSSPASGQFVQVKSSTAGTTVYTLTCKKNNVTYNIARFTVKFMDNVGPFAHNARGIDTTFLTKDGVTRLAHHDFNYSPLPTSGAKTYYQTALNPEESTFGFFDGSGASRHKGGSEGYYGYPGYNEYALVNDGTDWSEDSKDNRTKRFLNRDGNSGGNATNAELGYAMYADGSQKAGTAFSIEFEVKGKLCPGSVMYFSAWVGAAQTSSTKPTLDFIVVGVEEDGKEQNLTTFTSGEITNFDEWYRILFPFTFSSTANFTSYRLRIVNKAINTYGNDFWLDDVSIYLMPSAIEPVQAATPDECLTENSPLIMYTRLDYAQMIRTPSASTTTYYYRWVDKELADDEVATSNHVVPATYYGTPADTRYGMVEVSNQFDNITGSAYTIFNGTFAQYQDQVNTQLKEHPEAFVPQVVYIKENNLEGATPKDRYVAYIATKMAKINGAYSNYYTCEVANSLSELGSAGECATRKGTPVAFGVGINSSVDGAVKGQMKPVCANFAYDLTYEVNFAYLDDNGKVVQETSAYVSHWLFGNAAAVTANPALYGNYTFEQIQTALENYKPSASATDPNTVIVNRLVNNGVLTLCQYGTGADVDKVLETESNITYVVMPIAGEKSLTFTAFPVARIHPKAPSCTLPQSITLEFKGNGEGDEEDTPRDVMTFVKSYTEEVPAFVATRPRRVRVPYYTYDESGARARVNSKAVLVNLTNPGKEYILGENIYLYSTDDKSFTPSSTTSFEAVTISADKPITQTSRTNPVAITFTGLSNLNEGHTYTFKVLYTPKTEGENATQEEIDAYCGGVDPDDPTKLRPGEAYITFVIVPELLYLDENANLDASWNDDYNWIFKNTSENKEYNIAPLPETSVILATGNHILLNRAASSVQEPANATSSNLADPNALPYITYDINYEPYTANNVYVPAGTAIVGQTNIDVKGGYTFDMPINPGKWTMTSMPIQGVVSGDIFIPQDGEGEITYNTTTGNFDVKKISQTPGSWAADREVYSFYNSLFNQSVVNVDVNNITYDITSSTWSFGTNALNTPFGAGYGWSLGYDGDKEGEVMRFPKNETEYHYFRNDTWLGMSEASLRREGTLGKPAFTGNTTLTLKCNENNASKVFVLGNPTFAYIDLTKLAAENRDVIEGTFYLSGLTSGSRFDHVTGKVVAENWYTTNGVAPQYLAPMHAVLVVKKGDAATSLNIKVSEDMLVTENGSKEGEIKDADKRNAPARAEVAKAIYIAAETSAFSSTALLMEREDASNEALETEDADAFLLDMAKTPFAIYTVSDGKALAINQIADQTIVPLGFFAQKQVLSEQVTFSGDDRYLAEWDLVDNQTGSRETLYSGFATTLSMNNQGVIRYYLEHARKGIADATTGFDDLASTGINAYAHDGQLTVYSADDMTDFCLYDAAGRTIATSKNAGRMAQFDLANGVYVVRASGDVIKVIVK